MLYTVQFRYSHDLIFSLIIIDGTELSDCFLLGGLTVESCEHLCREQRSESDAECCHCLVVTFDFKTPCLSLVLRMLHL